MKQEKNNKLEKMKGKNKMAKELEEAHINLTELKIQENLGTLISYIPKVLKLLEKRLVLHEAPISKSTIRGFFATVLIILIGSFVLVFLNKLDSSGFTFIVGTILGYFLSTAKMFIKKDGE